MNTFSISPAAWKAIRIGSLCTVSYLAVYLARNILSAVTPQMIEAGVYSTEEIGTLSSVYFITYAFGQLFNGAIGDRIPAKYMVGFGLLLSGAGNMIFGMIAGRAHLISTVIYGAIGFFLSMVYAPMTKTVAENTEPIYATRCSVGYTFASLLGSPAAGLLAAMLTWQIVFYTGSAFLIVMGTMVLTLFTVFERRGDIRHGVYQRPKNVGSVKMLVQRRIIRFSLVAALTGVIRTAVIFWLPTYYAQYLGFSATDSAKLFTVTTLITSFSALLAIWLYERVFARSIDRAILTFFSVAAVSFLGAFASRQPLLNIVFIVSAIFCSNMASNMLWSVYCPGLRDSGVTSSATGFLDFTSYMAAAASSKLFANAVDAIGWSLLILIWMDIMVCGVLLFLPFHGLKRLTNGKNVVE